MIPHDFWGGIAPLRRWGVVLYHMLILWWERVDWYCQMRWTFYEFMDLIPMGKILCIMVSLAYKAGKFDLSFKSINIFILGFLVLLLIWSFIGFTFVLLFPLGWWGLNQIHLRGINRRLCITTSLILGRGMLTLLSNRFGCRLVCDWTS